MMVYQRVSDRTKETINAGVAMTVVKNLKKQSMLVSQRLPWRT